MISKEHLTIIEQTARDLFEKIDMQGDLKVESNEDDSIVVVSVKVDEPKIYIGEKGQTLFEIQHILKLFIRKKIQELVYISLDINDYKKNKEEYLRDLANTTADEVVLFKKEKELPPMPASERKIIHMALTDRDDVISESSGEDVERRIVVKPKRET